MNALVIGSDPTPLLRYLPDDFLLIDDGPIIDTLHTRARRFDVSKHQFNPLKDMDYRRARDFIAVLDAVFPEGENTLTKKASNFAILNALLEPTTRVRKLDQLFPMEPDRKDTGRLDAYQKIRTLLLSPVLERVLNSSLSFTFEGRIVARLNRAELGDFDAFVLANLLISQYRGPVVIPDFGFYAAPFHVALIRQNRLIAGIRSFDERPDLTHHLLMIEEKIPSRATPTDAELLAVYRGLIPHTNEYNDFIHHAVSGP